VPPNMVAGPPPSVRPNFLVLSVLASGAGYKGAINLYT
jgi:hypothetical protein